MVRIVFMTFSFMMIAFNFIKTKAVPKEKQARSGAAIN